MYHSLAKKILPDKTKYSEFRVVIKIHIKCTSNSPEIGLMYLERLL